MSVLIASLQNYSEQTICDTFVAAFSDYAIHFSRQQIRAMLIRRGFNKDLSFAAIDNRQIASFIFNGIGSHNGILTAYDTGTGTIPEYRGLGLTAEIFRQAIPVLKKNGIEQYLLEVLQDNDKALSIYRKLGFETTREFNCFNQSCDKIISDHAIPDIPCELKQIDIAEIANVQTFGDFTPSWQNSIDSVKRAGSAVTAFGVIVDDKLAAYMILEPEFGDLAQIAVKEQYRRKGIGSMLLKKALEINRHDRLKIINTETSCESLTGFLASKNIPIASRQYEMVLNLK